MNHPQFGKKIWCVSASVTQNGIGTRHFDEGSNVYCFPLEENHGIIKVVGQHRTTHRFVTVFVNADQLTDWQALNIDQPLLIREFQGDWDDSDESRQRAEAIANHMRSRYN